MFTAAIFVAVTLGISIYASRLFETWYGIGVVAGSLIGWCVAYLRLRWVEKHLDEHIFCTGSLIEYGKGRKLPSKVYDVREAAREERVVREK